MAEPKEAQSFEGFALDATLTVDDRLARKTESLAVRMAKLRAIRAAREALDAELLPWADEQPGSNADPMRFGGAVNFARLLAAVTVAMLIAWLLGPFSPLPISRTMGLAIFAGLALSGLIVGLVSTARS